MNAGELVFVLDETDAAAVHSLLMRRLKEGPWDLTSDEDICESRLLLALEEKLRAYLDDGAGAHVCTVGNRIPEDISKVNT